VRAVSVPSPSAPLSFEPQHQTESPSTTTQLECVPHESSVYVPPGMPATCTGVDQLSVSLPSPSL